jgi:pentatricopeptide repeat protein
MQLAGIQPDYVTIIAILSACANLGATGLGIWVNRLVLGQPFKDNVRVNNSLIDMYSRCGCIEFARHVFDNMPERSLVSWNSIITGFALNGNPHEALKYFNSMKSDKIQPDGMSFTGALTACSHAGLIQEALKLFEKMQNEYKIKPRIEHYGCIVDLYSRAGRLKEALNVIKKMPMKPNKVVIGSLLAACRAHNDVSLAENLMDHIAELDPGGDSNYVLLSNIYAADKSWKSASKVRRKMKEFGIRKKPGVSSIEIDSTIHEFVSGDKSHVDSEGVYVILDTLSYELSVYGYIPESREIYEYE